MVGTTAWVHRAPPLGARRVCVLFPEGPTVSRVCVDSRGARCVGVRHPPHTHDDACVRIRASEMLDLQLFRDSGAPEDVRESQRRRGADATLVDAVIAADALWRSSPRLLQMQSMILPKPSLLADRNQALKPSFTSDPQRQSSRRSPHLSQSQQRHSGMRRPR